MERKSINRHWQTFSSLSTTATKTCRGSANNFKRLQPNDVLSGILIVCMILAATSCSKSESPAMTISMKPPVITGYHLRDAVGNSMGHEGAPNTLTEIPGQGSSYLLVAYPNPSNSLIGLYLRSPDTAYKHIWMVHAVYQGEVANGNVVLGTSNINTVGIPLWSVKTTSNNFYIDLSAFPAGYYRVYMQAGDYLLYDNLVHSSL